jgi:hypothetical protein
MFFPQAEEKRDLVGMGEKTRPKIKPCGLREPEFQRRSFSQNNLSWSDQSCLVSPVQWVPVENGVVLSNGQYHLSWPATDESSRFFQLQYP